MILKIIAISRPKGGNFILIYSKQRKKIENRKEIAELCTKPTL